MCTQNKIFKKGWAYNCKEAEVGYKQKLAKNLIKESIIVELELERNSLGRVVKWRLHCV